MTKVNDMFQGESSRACPTFFSLGIAEAKSRRHNLGYYSPGWHLAIHLSGYVEETAMQELEKIAEKNDDKGIIQWFKYYLPRCTALVPTRRREKFLQGFWQAVEDERVF